MLKGAMKWTNTLYLISILGVLAVFLSVRSSFMDDAFISFEYVSNLYHGDGLVFNPPHHLEGITNIGWVLFLAAFGWIASIPVAAKFTSLLLVLSVFYLLHRLVRRIDDPRSGLIVGLVLTGTAATFDFTFFSFTGMETSLLAFLLLLALTLSTGNRRGSMLQVTVVLAACSLVRPEATVIAPLWLILSMGSGREHHREVLICLAINLLMISMITSVRYFYYGDLLPNTFIAKPTIPGEFFDRVIDLILHPSRITNISTPFASIPILGLMVAGAIVILRRGQARASRLSVCILLTGLLFSLYARPDWTGTGRYFAPYVPVGLLLFFTGSTALIHRIHLSERWKRCVLASLFLVTTGTGIFETIHKSSQEALNDYPGFVMTSKPLVPACRWIADHLPEGSSIATKRIGCLAYTTNMIVMDYKFGLTERDVALLVRENEGPFDLPTDSSLRDFWRNSIPDYFLEDNDIIAQLADPEDGSVTIHGLRYEPVREFPLAQNLSWVLLVRVSAV
jgi:hypothetical protein